MNDEQENLSPQPVAIEPEKASVADSAAEADPREEAPKRPADLPEKFWDPENGTVRTEALIKSYVELERRLGRSVPLPGDDDTDGWARLFDVVGRPATPDGYEIEPPHPLLSVDDEITSALHEAGFSQKQAQLVYDLAASRLLPTLESAVGDIEAHKEQARLADHFCGEERWAHVSDQMRRWAESHLQPEVFETLAGSFDGVVALFEMMKRQEPDLASDTGAGSAAATEQQLNLMVADPRYWRDRDPDFVSRVSDGFRRLYGD